MLRVARSFLVVAVLATAAPPYAFGQNLIPDPTFSSGISGWAIRDPSGTMSTTLSWNSGPGADGIPGFARLTGFGPGFFLARVCIAASAGTVYSWGGFLRLSAPLDYTAQFTLLFYSNSSCEGSSSLLTVYGPTLDATSGSPDTWHLRAGQDVAAPALTESVAFEVNGTSPNSLRRVDFDNVYFGPHGTVPPTAAVPVPTVSPAALGILAALLGAAGAWRVMKA